jgi:hypothetical protein
MKTKMLLLGALALSQLATAGSWFADGTETKPLNKAHAAFLKHDYRQLALQVKAVFMDEGSDEAAKRNSLELLERAYESSHGSIPVDWKLPSGISSLKVTLRRSQGPKAEAFALKIGGNAATKNSLKQVQLVRYPNQVVLDKGKQLGEWTEQEEPGDGIYFELDGPRTSEPAAEGLYLINLETTAGQVTSGWFILSNMLSSDTPVLRTPVPGQLFTTRTPTMRWDDFKSPEYKNYEWRGLWAAVVKDDGSADWSEIWHMDEHNPVTTEVSIGASPEGQGVSKLEDGKYRFYVSYKENRRFGPLRLGRQSVSFAPFQVKGH